MDRAENRISVDQAVNRLRSRIDNYHLRHVRSAGRGLWIAVKVFVAALVLMFVEFIILYPISPLLFGFAFLIVDALLVVGGILEFRKGIKSKPSKNSLLIGRSFAHYAQSSRGSDPISVGADGFHYINYIEEPNHHVLINGSTSSGKTATLLALAGRASLANGLNFLMLDWSGENEEWAKAIGATVWKVPENFKLNLFKLNGMGKESRASMAVESLVVAARLTALQSTRVKSRLLKFYIDGVEPTLFDLWAAICGTGAGRENVLNQRLRAIQRVVGYEPEEFWDGIFERNNVVSLAGLNESEKSLVVFAIIQRLAELFDKKPELKKEPKLMVILDEAWQFFKREKEFDRYRESSLEKVVRLGRKYGFGLVVSTQQLDDVPKVFINSCSLLLLHQQRESAYMGRDLLDLGDYNTAYLRSAAQGEMLLFDRGASQKGQWWSEYVKTMPLSADEIAELSKKFEVFNPRKISEPEMPIEVHDRMEAKEAEEKGRGTSDILKKIDLPSVAVYRFMLGLSKGGSSAEANKILRNRRWVTSLATLYGNREKPSLLERARSSGYAIKNSLTERGVRVVDAEQIIARQGIYSGGEEHKGLMRKVIQKIQDNGDFAFTLSDKDSFDVGEIRAKTKSKWDIDNLTIYECQTNAIRSEVEKGIEKARKLDAELVFVVPDTKISEGIHKINEGLNVVILE